MINFNQAEMSDIYSRCPHVATIGKISKEDYLRVIQKEKCDQCDWIGSHLWLCLREECLFVGCGSGKGKYDHSSIHEKEKAHPLQFDLTSKRIWCYSCNQEVILAKNDPTYQLPIENDYCSNMEIDRLDQSKNRKKIENSFPYPLNHQKQNEKSIEPILFEMEHSDLLNRFTRGINGLYNEGNTCYMNSALQALSNCVPLTSYFLDFAPLIMNHRYYRRISDSSNSKSNGKLAKSYLKYLQSMWIKSSNEFQSRIFQPKSIPSEIRSINPMFRSYAQQDAQEFLRCFMDQLHSELCFNQLSINNKQRHDSSSSSNSDISINISTNIESEYETCSSEFNFNDEQTNDDRNNDEQEKENYSSIDQLNSLKKTKFHSSNSNSIKSLSRTDSGVSLQINSNSHERDDFHRSKSKLLKKKICKKDSLIQSKSIISSIFDGFILNEIECLTCHRRSKTIETFQDLSLPIPSREQLEKFHLIQSGNNDEPSNSEMNEFKTNESWLSWFYSLFKNFLTLNLWSTSLTLQDCLQAFFQADELTGDNMYSCEKCGKLRNGIKCCRVLQLPEVLCIHLKRFRHDSMSYSKIGNYVSFPLVDLDMKQFLHKDCLNEIYHYDLFSVIVHYGRAGSGHYLTYALNHIDHQWYEYDDEHVRQVETQVVQNSEAYILFYRKKENHFSETYIQIREIQSKDEDYLLPYYISRYWINRLFYFAEPGPISNEDFLCKHGGVHPIVWNDINDLVLAVSENVWNYLSKKYGGSSACNILYPCRKCQLDDENLKCRQRTEKKMFLQFQRSEKENDGIFAISPFWFRQWQNFVSEKSSEIPGPISNEGISTTKNGIHRLIRRDCHYLQISESIWYYLYSIYGGGPELLIRSNSLTNNFQSDEINEKNRSSE